MKKIRVQYIGSAPGLFPEYNWAAQPGDIQEIEVADDADLTGHTDLALAPVDKPKPAPKEVQQA